MNLLHTLYMSLGSVAVLFIMTKIIGKRQMSQLSLFDYVNGITIGSIAAEMATGPIEEALEHTLAIVIYALVTAIISWITCKSVAARRFFTGKALILYHEGAIYYKNLQAAKLDTNEFLTQCRNQGYFNLSELNTAILEENGRISFLPNSGSRPVTPDDMQLSVPAASLAVNVIMDGRIIQKNLLHLGLDEAWLNKQLQAQGYELTDVFLGTCDTENKLSLYGYDKKRRKNDPFQ